MSTFTATPSGSTPTATVTPMSTYTYTATPFGTSITATATITVTPYGSTPTAVVTLTPTATPTIYVTLASPDPVVIKQNVVRPSVNKAARIDVKIAKAQRVVVKIYSLRGKLIKTLADRVVNAGTFEAVWEGVNQKGRLVSSGVYIVHIKTDTFEEKRKLAVVR